MFDYIINEIELDRGVTVTFPDWEVTDELIARIERGEIFYNIANEKDIDDLVEN